MLIFDIETGPLPEEQLLAVFERQYEPSEPPGEFDPDSVKYGNTKDPEKRRAKLLEESQKHAAAVANFEQDEANRRREHWIEFQSRAALDATTGQVLAIGYYSQEREVTLIDDVISGDDTSEAGLLRRFWIQYGKCRNTARPMCGFNIFGFDLPFIMRRSWILGVETPSSVMERGRFFDSVVFRDLAEVWQCGRREDRISLDELAKVLGLAGKPDGVNGGDFARLWSEDRAKAEEYLMNDLRITDEVACKLNVFL